MSRWLEPATVKRRWFAVVGGGVLVMLAYLAVRSGIAGGVGPSTVLLATASLLFVLGGIDPAPDAVPWYRFVGLGLLVFGAATVLYWVEPVASGGRTADDLAFALVGVATAAVFGFMGIDWFRGGHHYDLSRIEPGPILGRRGSREER